MPAAVAVVEKIGGTNNLRINVCTVTMDNSYPSPGGEAVTANQFGLNTITALFIQPASGFVGEYIAADGKIVVRYGDNNNASDSALVEVADTTDLSAVIFTVLALGR